MDYEPDEEEEQVLNVLRAEGRANPMLIREHTGLRKEYVSRALGGLRKAGVVDKATLGLYDHVPENDDEFDAQTVEIDSEDVVELVEVLRQADVAGADVWADRLQEEVGDGD